MLLLDFLKGVAAGIVIAIPVGPVGMLCVRRTVFEGALRGLVSGLGAAAGDAFFGSIAAFGVTIVSDWLLRWRNELGFAAGLLLLFLGAKALLTRPAPLADKPHGERLAAAFASTFALAVTNPGILLAFAGIFSALGAGSVSHPTTAAALISGVFVGSFVWWIGLVFCARPIRRVGVLRLNRIFGFMLALSGLVLLAAALLRWAAGA
jgi:threonine/homoserine/homoserine lactone efflux protein